MVSVVGFCNLLGELVGMCMEWLPTPRVQFLLFWVRVWIVVRQLNMSLGLRAWCDCEALFSATPCSTCFLLLVYVSLELSKFWLWCVDCGPVLDDMDQSFHLVVLHPVLKACFLSCLCIHLVMEWTIPNVITARSSKPLTCSHPALQLLYPSCWQFLDGS
jgi:hypothetical protein